MSATELTSPDAIRMVGGYTAPYALTQWQALEARNAIRLKAFRGEITSCARVRWPGKLASR